MGWCMPVIGSSIQGKLGVPVLLLRPFRSFLYSARPLPPVLWHLFPLLIPYLLLTY
jgi:hypothetical protein